MDLNTLQWIICIALTILGLVITAAIWKRASSRASIWWLGLSLLPLGALLTGMVPSLIDAWNSMALWFQKAVVQPIAPVVLVGLVLLGLGVLLMLVSRLIPYRKKDRAAVKTRSGSGTTTPSVTRTKPVYPDSTTTTTTNSYTNN